jgi:hypothetical protein
MKQWIGFDLDGTLAHYLQWEGVEKIGKPLEGMVERIKSYIKTGHHVKILTARVGSVFPDTASASHEHIEKWCELHIGVRLPITSEKDQMMVRLYDDRAVQVIANSGMTLLDSIEVLVDELFHEKVSKDEFIAKFKALKHNIPSV